MIGARRVVLGGFGAVMVALLAFAIWAGQLQGRYDPVAKVVLTTTSQRSMAELLGCLPSTRRRRQVEDLAGEHPTKRFYYPAHSLWITVTDLGSERRVDVATARGWALPRGDFGLISGCMK